MRDHSENRTMSENDERMEKLKPLGNVVYGATFIVTALVLFNWIGWLGLLLAIPVGVIAGVIVSGAVLRIFYTKK